MPPAPLTLISDQPTWQYGYVSSTASRNAYTERLFANHPFRNDRRPSRFLKHLILAKFFPSQRGMRWSKPNVDLFDDEERDTSACSRYSNNEPSGEMAIRWLSSVRPKFPWIEGIALAEDFSYREPGAARVFPYQNILTKNNSATNCLNLCGEFGYPAAGMEFGDECCKLFINCS